MTPSDSLAVIAHYWEHIFDQKLTGVSRSMPSSGAVDKVAKKKKLDFFEVPTGWKFFSNLLSNGKI